MISAPLPSPGSPRSFALPDLHIPWEGPTQVDPCKGAKEQLQEPGGASCSFPPLGGERNRRFGKDKKSQEEPQWGRSFPTPQHKLGKGNDCRVGMEEVMGAAGTHGERVRKTATGSRRARLGYGEGSSLHTAQKKKK